jgi:hypothetical protein
MSGKSNKTAAEKPSKIMKFAPPPGKKEVIFCSNPGVALNDKNAIIQFSQPAGTKVVNFYAKDTGKKRKATIKILGGFLIN